MIFVILVSLILTIFRKKSINNSLIIFLFFTILLRSFLGSEYTNFFFVGPFEVLKGLNFMRVDRIIPLLTSLIILYALKDPKNLKFNSIFVYLIVSAIFIQQISITAKKFHSSIRANLTKEKFTEIKNLKKEKNFLGIINLIIKKNNYRDNKYNLGNEKYSWDNYFLISEYKKIKNVVKDKRVMSVGVDPLVAVVNDIKVIDGYHTLYYLNYKYKFRKIIRKEIEKSSFLKEYYDGWGNRVYAFYNNKDNLQLDFLKAKEIGAGYIISGFEINNKNLHLRERISSNKIYIHSTSWQCYLCLNSDGLYLYEII